MSVSRCCGSATLTTDTLGTTFTCSAVNGNGVGTTQSATIKRDTAAPGTVPTGTAIDTSTAGAHALTVDATDAAGNASSVTVDYTVVAAPTVTAITPAVLGDGASRV